MAMTIPKGATMPTAGWPLLVTGHGTGGSFRDAITSGRVGDVTSADVDGTALAAATISIDFPMHGDRRGETELEPDVLFFNFANPRAARDNTLQGAADLMSLLYYVESADLDALTSPTGEAISFDSSRMALFMHSQGATHASLMIADEPLAANVVLSGVGGDLTQSLLRKSAPVDIASFLPFALADPDGAGNLPGGDFHPALALFQMFFDVADPVNVARRLHRRPRAGQAPTNVFMTYGLMDSYTPELSQEAYAVAGAIPSVRPTLVTFLVGSVDAPASENLSVESTPTTIAHRQYAAPTGVDGHFVATQSTEGRADTSLFLGLALTGQTLRIGN